MAWPSLQAVQDGQSFCLPFSLAGIHLICCFPHVPGLMLRAAGLCTTSVELCHPQLLWEPSSFLHNSSSARSASERAPAPAAGCRPRVSHRGRKGGIPQPQGCSAVAEVSLPASGLRGHSSALLQPSASSASAKEGQGAPGKNFCVLPSCTASLRQTEKF